MRLTVLGSGSSASGKGRYPSGYIVSHAGTDIILDLGFGCLKQLQRAGFDFTKINSLFFSHFHSDHINDLSAFCFSRFVMHEFLGTPAKFSIFGPKGIKKFFKGLSLLYPQLKKTRASVKELSSRKEKAGKFTVHAIKVPHVGNSLAISVSASGKRIVYGGDCGYNKALAEFAKDADLLILECSVLKRVRHHMTAEQAGQIAAAANAKRLMLTHFYPETDKVESRGKAKRFFNGRVLLARDLMKVSI
ncbi:MAG: MBL fold metallo-hydrolase [Candidatus Diapherotrites archaeon]|uniref:MBL fold metallo-hydrolase n=1 Tax=Candidatus Iainarchaeum sp. TaxID=3101447 RepID=A0A939C6K1_9ARCH|nr:MBL fold metallo-hydrolase [Candidatus Diapherotrites archaeon]